MSKPSLQQRVRQFEMMELPGQPRMMLVSDLSHEVERLQAALTELMPVAKKAFELIPTAAFGAAIANAERALQPLTEGGR